MFFFFAQCLPNFSAMENEAAAALRQVHDKIDSLSKTLELSFKAQLSLPNGRIRDLEEKVKGLCEASATHFAEAQGLRSRIDELEKQILELQQRNDAAAPAVPPGVHLALDDAPPALPAPGLQLALNGLPVEGCKCGRAWELMLDRNGVAWREVVEYAISEHLSKNDFVVKLVQQFNSSWLCDYDKDASKRLQNRLCRELSVLVHGPDHLYDNWVFFSVKCHQWVLCGCVYCKGFNTFDCNAALKERYPYDRAAIQEQTNRFKAFIVQSAGVNLSNV